MTGLRIAALAMACAAMAAVSGAAAQSGAAVQPVEVKYAPSPFGEGAILSGPLDKAVFYTQRVHLKAGGLVPPHTHPDTRYTTVLSGTLYVCSGDKVAADAVKAFPAGSFPLRPLTRAFSLAGRVDARAADPEPRVRRRERAEAGVEAEVENGTADTIGDAALFVRFVAGRCRTGQRPC